MHQIADFDTVSLYPVNIPFSKYHNITKQRHPANPTSDFKNHELMRFFFYHQYDEERFPHFRACDKVEEMDEEGNCYESFCFYDFY